MVNLIVYVERGHVTACYFKGISLNYGLIVSSLRRFKNYLVFPSQMPYNPPFR
jgi:hypothetical protein